MRNSMYTICQRYSNLFAQPFIVRIRIHHQVTENIAHGIYLQDVRKRFPPFMDEILLIFLLFRKNSNFANTFSEGIFYDMKPHNFIFYYG